MHLTLENFGRFESFETPLKSTTAPNGSGKTTILNAYLYALTGRTLTGFEPRRKGTPDSEPTTVILKGLPGLPLIRRTYIPATGAMLYVSEQYTTQTDFVRACAERGVDIDFAALCADANVLTNPALTSEDLRKLLTRADVMDGGEVETLRKEAADVRKKRKVAEQFALSNVSIPARTVEPLNAAERMYLNIFKDAQRLDAAGVLDTCVTCGQTIPKVDLIVMRDSYEKAHEIVTERSDEAFRLMRQANAYDAETQSIADAERLIAAASRAREDVQRYDARLQTIDGTLRELEANAVRADLPDGVELVTESTTKTGTSKSVCTLTYDGIPLKSVNRAKRIEICVAILDGARTRKGMQAFPIIVDNAESVQGLNDVANLIRLSVG